MGSKSLKSIRVLNLSVNVPGPVAAKLLQNLGAKITKVEPPIGDPGRTLSQKWYQELTSGQKVLKLDLKSEQGQKEFHKLLKKSDLLLTSTRPRALARLGLSWENLKKKHPKLCQVAIIGYSPPQEDRAGHDLTYQASLGLVNPPHLPRTLLADLAGAQSAVNAALALLFQRERTKRGGYAQVSIEDSAEFIKTPLKYGLTAPNGVLGGALPQYQLYKASDGKWIAFAALEEHFLKKFCDKLGLRTTGSKTFAEVFATKPAEYWEAWAKKEDIPIALVK